MRSFLIHRQIRTTRRRLLMAATATAAASAALVLALTGNAQAHIEPSYLQPAPDTQQLQAWAGTADGQTLSPASYAAVLCVGSTAYVSVHLILTNRPLTTFQAAYWLDSGPWTWTDAFIRTSWDGSGIRSANVGAWNDLEYVPCSVRSFTGIQLRPNFGFVVPPKSL